MKYFSLVLLMPFFVYAGESSLDASTLHQTTPLLESGGINNNKKDKLANIQKTFTLTRDVKLANPVRVFDNDLQVKTSLLNRDIRLEFTNTSTTPIIINRIGLILGSQECAFVESTNIKIAAKHSKSGFWIPRNQSMNCWNIVQAKLNAITSFNLVDIASNFDAIKYNQFGYGLFLYPISLTANYVNNDVNSYYKVAAYLVFARK